MNKLYEYIYIIYIHKSNTCSKSNIIHFEIFNETDYNFLICKHKTHLLQIIIFE